MTGARVTFVAAIAAAAVAGSIAPAPATRAAGDDGAAAAPFIVRIGGSGVTVRRVACGADGSVYAGGVAATPSVLGGVEEPSPDRKKVDPYFLTAFAPDGSVRWTRYLPLLWGSSWYRTAQVGGVAVGPDGSVWIAGGGVVPPVGADPETYRTDRHDGDAWVAKFSADGTPLFAENVGGTGTDLATAIVVLPDGDAVVAGTTASEDFPVTAAAQSAFGGGGGDGFAFRIRADGSGLAWSTYLGGDGNDEVTAAALEHEGCVVVATRVSSGGEIYFWDSDFLATRISGVRITRLTDTGAIAASAGLPHGDQGGVFGLGVAPDGRIHACGVSRFRGYATAPSNQGFVIRLAPEALAIEAVWRADSELFSRIAVGPAGEVLATGFGGPLVRIAPDFASSTRLAAASPAGGVADIAYGAGGAVFLVGNGLGSPLPHAEVQAGAYVARLGEADLLGPRRVRVSGRKPRSVELTWTSAGSDVVAFEVEQGPYAAGLNYRSDEVFERRLRVAPDRRRAVVDGLRPADNHVFRVTAVHASGVRTPTSPVVAVTPPGAVTGFSVASRDDGVVQITWDDVAHGGPVAYRLERAFSGASPGSEEGAFSYVRPRGWWLRANHGRGRALDPDPPGGLVTYRIRAYVEFSPHRHGPWSYAVIPTGRR